MINLKRVKILGAHLTVACALQICLYLAMSISAERYQWLFYFNPRFGLYFVESVIKGEPPPPGIFGWMSAAWVLAPGLLRGCSLGSKLPAVRPFLPFVIAARCQRIETSSVAPLAAYLTTPTRSVGETL
jgi:hypothetical protein